MESPCRNFMIQKICMRHCLILGFLWVCLGECGIPFAAQHSGEVRGSQSLDPKNAPINALVSKGSLLQIPGPNPVIVRGAKGTWDELELESARVFKDSGTYYWYYHARPIDKNRWRSDGYRIGVATSLSPLGPWRK
jgi:hypothetical protein